MTDNAEDKDAEAPEPTAGEVIRHWRARFQLTQAEFAERLGAAPSWVSQVERGKLRPSNKRMRLVAAALGIDPAELLDEEAGRPAPDSIAYACLWRARADLLSKMGAAATTTPQRRRLDRLSRDVLRAAAGHSKVQAYTTAGALFPLEQIAREAPESVRWAVAVEIAGMKIDAPFEAGFDKRKRLELLDVLLPDLHLPATVHRPLVDAFVSPPRKRPYWQDLHSTGGAFGGVLAAHAAEGDVELLLAHDPVGWLGFDFVAGSWLVRAAALGEPGQETGTDDTGRAAGAWVGSGTASVGAGLVAGAVALGPVLGAALASSATATRGRSRAGGSRHSATEVSSEVLETARVAQAVGREWVRVEVTKLLALYSAFPEAADGALELRLPSRSLAREHLMRLDQHFEEAYADEEVLSGTSDHDENDRLREYRDLRDSFRAVAKRL